MSASIRSLNATFLWEIPNFRKVTTETGSKLDSSAFTVNNVKFQLELYPNGDREEHKGTVIVRAKVAEGSTSWFLANIKFFIYPNAEDSFYIACSSHNLNFNLINNKYMMHVLNHDELFRTEQPLLHNDKLRLLIVFSSNGTTFNDSEFRLISLEKKLKILEYRADFKAFFNNKNMSDVQLIAGDTTFYAHKIILAKYSEFFAKIFNNSEYGQVEHEVIIEDVEAHVMLEMLRYIYTGEVNDLEVVADSLLLAAKKYAVHNLEDHCCQFLSGNFQPDNVIEYLKFADDNDIPELKVKAVQFIQYNATKICNHILKK